MQPDFASASAADVCEWGKSCALVAKWLLDDLRETHRKHIGDFWPSGIDGAPDMELASLYGDEVADYVGGVSTCLFYAKAAIAELEIRRRPN
jgi:hypothetical protein